MQVVRLLLYCGSRWIDLDAVDSIRNDTALHRIARSSTGINATAIIELLISAGAHIDCFNSYYSTPFDVAILPEICSLLQSKQRVPRLKCLCARLITDQELNYNLVWPINTAMNRFIMLHGDLSRQQLTSDESSILDDFDVFD
ncbi:unnamed protein product [Adineta steineri]|uniref:Ankyrin repeat protein n=1 Tax=Adineta steineri TaxID=433720 RepID=A0A814WZ73_9BILA|nr:unnamed protein product [Adineta steineri]CAF1258520.1 unnamed protein product [Adineta steineri]CAF3837116.1 unnamed protein product [Adineta steineri]CAF3897662.1 unnamed protein product [Adineta steineri]